MRNFTSSIILAALGFQLVYALPLASSGNCTDDQYYCGSTEDTCIPIEWVCDNIKDCAFGNDESNCAYLHSCPDGNFMCKSGECVSAKFKCDGRFDCSDGSDEAACLDKQSLSLAKQDSSVPVPQFIKHVVCKLEEFRCEKSNKCIEKSKVCNGFVDCDQMEDEFGCVESCKNGGKSCSNGVGCYLNRCDGYRECEDGSDEEGCEYEDLPSMDAFFADHFHGCRKDEYKCSDGNCISKDKFCDGYNDCLSGEDEGGLCGKCSTYECSYRCQDTPKGPECYCPDGLSLSADFKTCEAANLCLEDASNQCTQHCRMKGSTITCSCSKGYRLVGDTDCEVDEEHANGDLYFTVEGSSVRHSSIFNTSSGYYEEIVPASARRISSLTLRPRTDLLYFAANEGHHTTFVYETKNYKSNPKKFLSALDIKDIAVDWVTGNIYYTVEGQYPGVGVCTPDGKYCKHLVDGEYDGNRYTQTYGGLIVHPDRGMVIYVSYNQEHPEGVVRLVGMDGVNDRVLSHQISRPKITSIAMDYVRDYLFVGEERAMIRHDLHTLKTDSVTNAPTTKSMLIFNGHFYFIGPDSKLRKAKFGSSTQEVIHHLDGLDNALAINNSIYYNKTDNPCSAMSCSHICVLTEKRAAKCLCPDQYTMNDGKCEPIDNHISRVKLSAERMLDLCNENTVCQNGGSCRPSYEDTFLSVPSCDCPPGFAGLYCEVPSSLEMHDEEPRSSGWKTFWTLLLIVAALVIALYFVSERYPELIDRTRNLVAFSPHLSRVNAVFKRIPHSVASVVSTSTLNKDRTSDPSKNNGFMNPVFGASPVVANSSLNKSTTLEKSPAAALNIDG